MSAKVRRLYTFPYADNPQHNPSTTHNTIYNTIHNTIHNTIYNTTHNTTYNTICKTIYNTIKDPHWYVAQGSDTTMLTRAVSTLGQKN